MAISIENIDFRKISLDMGNDDIIPLSKVYLDDELYFAASKPLPSFSGSFGMGYSFNGPTRSGKMFTPGWDCRGFTSLSLAISSTTMMGAGDPYGLHSITNVYLSIGGDMVKIHSSEGTLFGAGTAYSGVGFPVVDISKYSDLSDVKIYIEISDLRAGDPGSEGMSHTAGVSITNVLLE